VLVVVGKRGRACVKGLVVGGKCGGAYFCPQIQMDFSGTACSLPVLEGGRQVSGVWFRGRGTSLLVAV
jgi:hypothetical protein